MLRFRLCFNVLQCITRLMINELRFNMRLCFIITDIKSVRLVSNELRLNIRLMFNKLILNIRL